MIKQNYKYFIKQDKNTAEGDMMYEENVDETEMLKTGVALQKNGKYDEALEIFNDLLKLNPQNATAYRERAMLLHVMWKKELKNASKIKDQALQDYKKAREIDSLNKKKDVTQGEAIVGDSIVEDSCIHKCVRDVMKKNIVTVPFGAMVLDVLDLMLSKKVSGVLVSDGTKIVGIVTDKDLIENYRYVSGKDPTKVSIKDFMSDHPITISPDTSLEDAAGQMVMGDIRHLIVCEGDEPVGMVSFKDIFCMLYY
jgi:CBS domain-containing protein